MTHPSEGTLQAFLDQELPGAERSEIAAHLLACAPCRGELDRLRADSELLSAALRHIDIAPALGRAEAEIRRRHSPSIPRVQIGPKVGVGVQARRALVRAAVLILFAAAAASAAIPGSPVLRWIRSILPGSHPAAHAPAPRPAPPAAPQAAQPPTGSAAGVSVAPEEGRVRIVLRDAAPGVQVHVRLVDEPRAVVEATGLASGARFASSPGMIEMIGGGTGAVRIEVPRAARHAVVEVDGKPYFFKDGDDVRVFTPVDSAGGEVVFRLP